MAGMIIEISRTANLAFSVFEKLPLRALVALIVVFILFESALVANSIIWKLGLLTFIAPTIVEV